MNIEITKTVLMLATFLVGLFLLSVAASVSIQPSLGIATFGVGLMLLTGFLAAA